eukprot:7969388-Pyramimonas_sp.AAC.1
MPPLDATTTLDRHPEALLNEALGVGFGGGYDSCFGMLLAPWNSEFHATEPGAGDRGWCHAVRAMEDLMHNCPGQDVGVS